jgi:hypothetical protein
MNSFTQGFSYNAQLVRTTCTLRYLGQEAVLARRAVMIQGNWTQDFGDKFTLDVSQLYEDHEFLRLRGILGPFTKSSRTLCATNLIASTCSREAKRSAQIFRTKYFQWCDLHHPRSLILVDYSLSKQQVLLNAAVAVLILAVLILE